MNRFLFVTSLMIACGLALAGISSKHARMEEEKAAAAAAATPADLVAVEDNMHEFMEYYFQLPFRRVEKLMRKAPEESRAWKEIKSDALILAESGNLLIGRHEEEGEEWDKYSVAVRDEGAKFYQASLKSEFDAAKESFKAMVDQCNACHDHFAEGKHQQRVR